MLATEYRASVEASACWSKVSALLAAKWRRGTGALVGRRKGDLYGVRIQGLTVDPLELLVLAISAEQALEELRTVDVKAFFLLVHEVEFPMDRWFDDGHGYAEALGFTLADKDEVERRYGLGKEWIYLSLTDQPLAEIQGLLRR